VIINYVSFFPPFDFKYQKIVSVRSVQRPLIILGSMQTAEHKLHLIQNLYYMKAHDVYHVIMNGSLTSFMHSQNLIEKGKKPQCFFSTMETFEAGCLRILFFCTLLRKKYIHISLSILLYEPKHNSVINNVGRCASLYHRITIS
jgi:hypothetical protein